MRAQPGDILVIEGFRTGQPARRGTIVEVGSADGAPPYVVSWLDAGGLTTMYPGPDAHVVPAGQPTDAPGS
ncbi:DUF1918 domain-containing protein [Kutzneria sp. CA-103260]|uniref:DUF1918 domain-containing protein n=1 Tax=Kutzneria sp. CA-103260 TaxID=2802641 RepID=UPI001BA5C943|nr:DUF1918 domain-containing protein [Kutzneria sp. CA-103260]